MNDPDKSRAKKSDSNKKDRARDEPKSETDLKKLIQKMLLLGGALSALLAKLFPQLGELAQSAAYGLAIALVLAGALLFYIRRRQRRISAAEPAAPVDFTSSVFRTLNPIEDGESLCARDRDVQDVWTLIQRREANFAVVWGESGCGKTSLLRAGVLPLLRTKGLRPIYLPRPTADPVAAIEAQVAAVTTSDRPYQLPTAVVIIDQFEEIFFAANSDIATRALCEWIYRGPLPTRRERVVLVVSIRSDQFFRLQSLGPFIPDPTSKANSHHLRNFSRDEAKELMDEGIENDHVPFEAGMVEKLLDDLTVNDLIRPAELQLVATELKQRRLYSRRGYDDIGGARGILTSYVRDTIAGAPKSAVATALLRSMCMPAQPLKSLVDLAAADLLRVVQQAIPHARRPDIDINLKHLIAARIVIQSEIEKYNLVHDLFAELIQEEARVSETRGEKADRILRKHLSDQRGGASARIPMVDIALILRNASPGLRGTPEARRLLWRSAIAPVGNVMVLATIVALLGCAASYSSVYLSTAAANYPDGGPFIVLRSGHPSLKFLPFVGMTELDTGFSMEDVSEDPRSADEFPRETLTGWRLQVLRGLPGWTEKILERQSGMKRVTSLRLLDQPRAARKQAVHELRGYPTFQVAISLSLVGIADPSSADGEGLEALWRLADGQDKDFSSWGENNMMYNPMTLSLAAVFMAGQTASLKSPPSISDLLSQLQVHDNETIPERAKFALMALAQSTPSLVGTATIDQVLDLYKASDFESRRIADVVLAFGDTSPTLGAYCLQKLLALAVEYHGTPQKAFIILRLAEALSNDNPASVNSESLAPLKDLWARSDAGIWAISLSVLARANPDATPSAAVDYIRRVVDDSANPQYRRNECAIAMVRLGSLRPRWVQRSANALAYKLANSTVDLDKIDGRVLHAVAALLEYYRAYPQQRQDMDQLVETISSVAPVLTEGILGPRTSGKILLRNIVSLDPSAITERTVQILAGYARLPRASGGDNVISPLSEAADKAPALVLEHRDLLYSVPRESPEATQAIHNMMVAVVARASYAEQRTVEHSLLARKLTKMMLDKTDRDRRALGAYGAFFLTLDDPEVDMKDELRRMFHSGAPIVQYAAGQALEMMSLAELYHSAKEVPSKMPLFKVRLRLLEQYAEAHLRYAAGIILAKIE